MKNRAAIVRLSKKRAGDEAAGKVLRRTVPGQKPQAEMIRCHYTKDTLDAIPKRFSAVVWLFAHG